MKMKKILVTGACGFIGFHLSSALKKRDNFVIGLDNYNSYYDQNLKYQREKVLNEQDINIVNADINDKDIVRKILEKNKIDTVVHLAAQAGVRYSFENPDAYVSSNLVGFVNLLEVLKSFKNIKLVFASSSSVYGLNEKIPFSTDDKTDSPANLYGATKKANESIAYAYHNLFQIPIVALRYFTVYGPYGRPDMAYFKFTKSILEEKPIEIFGDGNMLRDFTYIDDAVEGTISAIDYCNKFDIFNIGNNKPVKLMDFISVLEKHLGKKAKLKHIPVFKGEMLKTYADIIKSQEKLNFNPKTSIEEGLKHFVKWYKSYQKDN
ncbi:MAG: GDP-mannose 4,6-dehydratase [Parachlamydiales bacterium]|nr:GDP-mannose 4,6-dehydratase [Parachlamydiales bacterium]